MRNNLDELMSVAGLWAKKIAITQAVYLVIFLVALLVFRLDLLQTIRLIKILALFEMALMGGHALQQLHKDRIPVHAGFFPLNNIATGACVGVFVALLISFLLDLLVDPSPLAGWLGDNLKKALENILSTTPIYFFLFFNVASYFLLGDNKEANLRKNRLMYMIACVNLPCVYAATVLFVVVFSTQQAAGDAFVSGALAVLLIVSNAVHRALEALEAQYEISRLDSIEVPKITSYSLRWGVVGICALVVTIWLRTLGVGLDFKSPALWVAGLLLLLLLAVASTGRMLPRLTDFCHSLAQLLATILVLLPLTYLVASTGFPLIDDGLARFDAMVSFDWDGAAGWVASYPLLDLLSRWAYYSIGVQLIAALWIGSSKLDRNDELLWLFIGSLLITSLIFVFTPAAGKIGHLGRGYLDLLTQIRKGEWSVMHYELTDGIITFPSFHTTMAIIVTYAVRHSRWALLVFGLLNLCMIASIPTVGGHYLTDLFGGLIVALASILIFRWLRGPRATVRVQEADANATSKASMSEPLRSTSE